MNEQAKQEENKDNTTSNNPEGKGGFGDHPENINKNGRPPKNWAWADLIEDAVDEMVDYKDNEGNKLSIEVKKALIKKLVQLALSGSTKAINILFDRTEGKPLQRIVGADGGAIDVLLNKIERTNYDEFARKAKEQMVANDQPVQNQGQTGGTDNLPTE